MPEAKQPASTPSNQPHWAIEILLDPQGGDLTDLVPGQDYPMKANRLEALDMFDQTALGWIPLWFPALMFRHRWTEQEELVPLTPQQRYNWFDQALAHYARETWPPQGPPNLKKRSVALSLLHMYCAAESQEIPTPDKL